MGVIRRVAGGQLTNLVFIGERFSLGVKQELTLWIEEILVEI